MLVRRSSFCGSKSSAKQKCCDSLEGVELCGTAQGLAAGTGGDGPAGSQGRCTQGLCKAAPSAGWKIACFPCSRT